MFEINRFFAAAALCALGSACQGGYEDEASLDREDDPGIATSEDELSADSGGSLLRGSVFVMTNDAAENAIAAYARSPRGELQSRGTFPTGGAGSGAGLGSQGSLIMIGSHLLAVNAGSNSLSLLRIREGHLTLVDVVPSGGEGPTSVTARGNLVYVLNASGDGNITGFRYRDGHLLEVPGSTRSLSTAGGSSPAQVEFSPDGSFLVVSERATNVLSTYTLNRDGTTSGPSPTASSGETPFGFAFTPSGTLIVSEAFGGRPNESAVSSYETSGARGLRPVTASLGAGETAACWIVITPGGHYAYSANAAGDSLSSFRVDRGGALTVVEARVASGEGARPLDLTMSRDGRFLFALNSGTDTIGVFALGSEGYLIPLGAVPGLAATSIGIAAR